MAQDACVGLSSPRQSDKVTSSFYEIFWVSEATSRAAPDQGCKVSEWMALPSDRLWLMIVRLFTVSEHRAHGGYGSSFRCLAERGLSVIGRLCDRQADRRQSSR